MNINHNPLGWAQRVVCVIAMGFDDGRENDAWVVVWFVRRLWSSGLWSWLGALVLNEYRLAVGGWPYYWGCGWGRMQSNHVTRRALLSGVAAAGAASVAGCATRSGVTAGSVSGSGWYLPGGDRFWGGDLSAVSWFSPKAALEHESLLRETELLEFFEFAFGLQGASLSFEELTLVYYAMPQELRVFEGSFTTTNLQEAFQAATVSMDGEYKGYRLGTVQSYQDRAIGLQDGRGIFVDDSSAIENPRVGVKAAIDTASGAVEPYLASQSDVEPAEKFLDTELWWEFRSHQHEHLQGLRSEANSFTVLSGDAYRVKKLFGFTPGSEIREEEATAFAVGMDDSVFGLEAPSYTRVDNVVVFEETHSFADWN